MIEPGKTNVIMIAYYFPPGEEIGGFRPFRLRKYLQQMGYACHVITASEPADASAPGLVWVPDNLASIWDGRSNGKRPLKAYVELLVRQFFLGHLGIAWSLEAAARCRQIILSHPGQKFVVFSTFPPLGVLFAGLIVRARTGMAWISDFRDPIPVDSNDPHLPRRLLYCNSLVERSVFRAADCVIANTQAAADVLATRYPRARSKLHVIWNGFDPEEQPQARQSSAQRQKTIVHAGALYEGRNPSPILESMSRLWRSSPEQAGRTCVLLLGFIDFEKAGLNRNLSEQGQCEGWLRLLPPVARAEAQRLTEEADGLLLVQPQTQIQIPGKLFEYICIGRPILALVPPQSAVEYILSNAGVPYICVYTDDEPAMVDQKLLQFLGLPARPVPYSQWFRTNFNAQTQAIQLASIIDAVSVEKAQSSRQS